MKGNIAKSDRNMKREKSTKAGPFHAKHPPQLRMKNW